MASTTDTPALTRAELAEILRTGVPHHGVSAMRAVSALGRRSRKDYTDLLLEVVTDSAKQPRLRYIAALEVYKVGGDRGEVALVEAARRADAGSAPALALGLGRIGGADKIALVEQLAATTPRHARPVADFAATLLAYRHHLDGHDARAPSSRAMQDLGRRRARPIEVSTARAPDLDRALAALSSEPIDVALDRSSAWRVNCEPNTFVWVWSADSKGGSLGALGETRLVAGLLLRRHPIEPTYSLSAIGLATPTRGGVRLTVHRAGSGRVLYAGVIDRDGNAQLQARDHPGLAAVDIRGRVGEGGAEVLSARSAVLAQKARSPKPA